MIRFSCPACKTAFDAKPVNAGAKFNCTKCGQRLQVPSPPANKTVLGTIEPVPLRSGELPEIPIGSHGYPIAAFDPPGSPKVPIPVGKLVPPSTSGPIVTPSASSVRGPWRKRLTIAVGASALCLLLWLGVCFVPWIASIGKSETEKAKEAVKSANAVQESGGLIVGVLMIEEFVSDINSIMWVKIWLTVENPSDTRLVPLRGEPDLSEVFSGKYKDELSITDEFSNKYKSISEYGYMSLQSGPYNNAKGIDKPKRIGAIEPKEHRIFTFLAPRPLANATRLNIAMPSPAANGKKVEFSLPIKLVDTETPRIETFDVVATSPPGTDPPPTIKRKCYFQRCDFDAAVAKWNKSFE